jgi:hypothetical protein
VAKIEKLAMIIVIELFLRGRVEPLVKSKKESQVLKELSLSRTMYFSCVRSYETTHTVGY